METEKNSVESSENLGYELKPCPFCAHKAYMQTDRVSLWPTLLYWVWCLNCGATGPGKSDSEEQAAKRWNTRKKPYESKKKLPCPRCGTPHPQTWFSSKGVGIICSECDFARWGDSEIGAIRAWNKEKRKA